MKPPNCDAVYLVTAVVEYLHQFTIAVCELILHIIGQTVLVWIQIGLELLKLIKRVLERFAYHLPFFGERQNIDVKLSYHDFNAKCRECIYCRCYVFVLGEVKAPMRLNTYSVYLYPLFLKHTYHTGYPVTL